MNKKDNSTKSVEEAIIDLYLGIKFRKPEDVNYFINFFIKNS
jgi:hypothetical protein